MGCSGACGSGTDCLWERALPVGAGLAREPPSKLLCCALNRPCPALARSAADPHRSPIPSLHKMPGVILLTRCGSFMPLIGPEPGRVWFGATHRHMQLRMPVADKPPPTGNAEMQRCDHRTLPQRICSSAALAQCEAAGTRLSVQRHERPAPSEQKDLGLFVKRGHPGWVRVSRRTGSRVPAAG